MPLIPCYPKILLACKLFEYNLEKMYGICRNTWETDGKTRQRNIFTLSSDWCKHVMGVSVSTSVNLTQGEKKVCAADVWFKRVVLL